MAVLILNKAPYHMYPYDKWLREEGELILLNAEETVHGYETSNYTEIHSFTNYEQNGCVELTALELYKKYRFHSIVAAGEYDLLRAGKLRDLLGIQGQTWESALAYRDKVTMKNMAAEHGIPVPLYRKIHTSFDLIEFVKKHDYPVVVKPVDGAAAVNTNIIHDGQDLEGILSGGLAQNLMVEKFVEGEMYHVDGFVAEGEVIFIWPSRYINGCLAYQEGNYIGSVLLERGNPIMERLVHFTKELINKLPTPSYTAFHAEIFHTPNDELVLCEIASRLGGPKIYETILEAFGLQMRELFVQMHAGMFNEVEIDTLKSLEPKSIVGWLLIPPKEGILNEVKSDENPPDWVSEYKILAEPGQKYFGAKRSIDQVASFVIKGNSEEVVEQRIDEMATWFQRKCEWKENS